MFIVATFERKTKCIHKAVYGLKAMLVKTVKVLPDRRLFERSLQTSSQVGA